MAKNYKEAVEQLKGFTKGCLLLNPGPDTILIQIITVMKTEYPVYEYWVPHQAVMYLDCRRTIEPGGVVEDPDHGQTVAGIQRIEGYDIKVLTGGRLGKVEFTRKPVYFSSIEPTVIGRTLLPQETVERTILVQRVEVGKG